MGQNSDLRPFRPALNPANVSTLFDTAEMFIVLKLFSLESCRYKSFKILGNQRELQQFTTKPLFDL